MPERPRSDTRDPLPLDPPATLTGKRLDSWKEIATYLNRGTRTVQRWEREEQLPVHRLHHDKLGSVYAYAGELDAWWRSRGDQLKNESPLATAAERSIAVLPLADLSREKDQEYFCEGMADELCTVLGKVSMLRVVSRAAAKRFTGSEAGSRQVGRQLRAGALLEGSVRRSGTRVRINVQLVDADSGYQLWSETYDRDMSDVFAIQQEIARSVAEALEVTLTPRESAALAKQPARNAVAYDFYLRARKFYYQYGPRDIEFAIQLFLRAIECDPDYAMAFAGLADCWSFIYLYSNRADPIREQALWAGDRAVQLDAECAQAQASRALALSLCGRDDEARQAFEESLRLDPVLFEAHYFYARHCFARGDATKALAEYERAVEVRPEDYQSPLLMAQIYDDLHRPDDARAVRIRGIELAEQHLKMNPDDARAIYCAANGMAALGRRERAREWADRVRLMRPDDGMVLYNVGCIYSLLGCTEDALDTLERAAKHGLIQKGWYEHDSNLDLVRSHPRFQKLLRTLS